MHKITKIRPVNNPKVQTAESLNQYQDSVFSGLFKINDTRLSPHINYSVVGKLSHYPSVGRHLIMDSLFRNGVLTRERFSTSEITKITEDGFETKNSVYKMEEVDEYDLREVISSEQYT